MGLHTVLVVSVVQVQMSTGGDNVVCGSETTSDSEVTLSDSEDTTSDNTVTVVVGIGSDIAGSGFVRLVLVHRRNPAKIKQTLLKAFRW